MGSMESSGSCGEAACANLVGGVEVSLEVRQSPSVGGFHVVGVNVQSEKPSAVNGSKNKSHGVEVGNGSVGKVLALGDPGPKGLDGVVDVPVGTQLRVVGFQFLISDRTAFGDEVRQELQSGALGVAKAFFTELLEIQLGDGGNDLFLELLFDGTVRFKEFFVKEVFAVDFGDLSTRGTGSVDGSWAWMNRGLKSDAGHCHIFFRIADQGKMTMNSTSLQRVNRHGIGIQLTFEHSQGGMGWFGTDGSQHRVGESKGRGLGGSHGCRRQRGCRRLADDF